MLSYGTARQDVRLRVFFGISIRWLCQGLKRERSILRNDSCSIAQIHLPHASLYWAVLRADDPLEAKPDGPKLETPKPTQAPPPPNSLPLKIFFAAAALALAVSPCTGLIMGWKYARRKSIVLLTLGAGVVVPAILSLV
jgi:hypothetical protein